MFGRLSWLRTFVLLVPLTFLGCGDDDGPGVGTGGGTDTGDAQDDTGVDDVTEDQSVDDVTTDTGTEDTAVEDTTEDTIAEIGEDLAPDLSTDLPPDIMADISDDVPPLDLPGDLEPYFPECLDNPNDCKTAAGGTACCPDDNLMSIRAARWDEDIVVIVNRTGAAASLDGWHLVHMDQNYPLPDVELPTIGRLVIHTNDSDDTPDAGHFYLGDGTLDLQNIDEIAVYDSDAFNSADHIRGFARWGFIPEPDSGSRIAVAVEAGIWTAIDEFIEVCIDGVGIVPTGCVCDPLRYHPNQGDDVCATEWNNTY